MWHQVLPPRTAYLIPWIFARKRGRAEPLIPFVRKFHDPAWFSGCLLRPRKPCGSLFIRAQCRGTGKEASVPVEMGNQSLPVVTYHFVNGLRGGETVYEDQTPEFEVFVCGIWHASVRTACIHRRENSFGRSHSCGMALGKLTFSILSGSCGGCVGRTPLLSRPLYLCSLRMLTVAQG